MHASTGECTEGIRLCQLAQGWLIQACLSQSGQELFAQVGEGLRRASTGLSGIEPAAVVAEQQAMAEAGIQYALEIVQKKGTPSNRETPVDLVTAATLRGSSPD